MMFYYQCVHKFVGKLTESEELAGLLVEDLNQNIDITIMRLTFVQLLTFQQRTSEQNDIVAWKGARLQLFISCSV
jgi:hypothetical protein